MPDYPNPYDFVPFEEQPPIRRQWDAAKDSLEHNYPDRYSGRLYCVLCTKTPLFIHGTDQQGQQLRKFFRQNNQICIPASSLKGVLRSIYEIVSNSCLSTLSEQFYNLAKVPRGYEPCKTLSKACPACLLFGMTEQEQTQTGGSLAGRIHFSDANLSSQETPHQIEIPAPRGGPQPRHHAFYFDPKTGHILGRKLYYHHRDYRLTKELYNSRRIKIEAQSGEFSFHLDFRNLRSSELSYLVYTLVLEPHLDHHLGYGKPYGLGSAQIQIKQVEWWAKPDISPQQRFLTWQPSITAENSNLWIEEQVKKTLGRWGKRLNNNYEAYGKFEYILTWPGRTLYKYPDHNWFHTSGNSAITLAEYQQGIREPNRGNRP